MAGRFLVCDDKRRVFFCWMLGWTKQARQGSKQSKTQRVQGKRWLGHHRGLSLPAYDEVSSSGSSASGLGGDAAEQMLALLRQAASKDGQVAKQMEALFPDQSEK